MDCKVYHDELLPYTGEEWVEVILGEQKLTEAAALEELLKAGFTPAEAREYLASLPLT